MEEHGTPPMRGGVRRRRAEIALAVVATTLSLVVIFLPIAFMGGMVGRFFHSFGMTVAVAIVVIAVRLVHADADALLRGSSSVEHGASHGAKDGLRLSRRSTASTARSCALVAAAPLGRRRGRRSRSFATTVPLVTDGRQGLPRRRTTRASSRSSSRRRAATRSTSVASVLAEIEGQAAAAPRRDRRAHDDRRHDRAGSRRARAT